VSLFDPGPPLVPEPHDAMSATRRLTARKNLDLALGRNPATGCPLLTTGETCGDCAHHVVWGHRSRNYHKCNQVHITNGPATDIRLSWPACTKFQPNTQEAPEP
jgi:hypothetical protein